MSAVPVIQRVTHQASVSLRLTDDQLAKLSALLPKIQQSCRGVRIEASTTRKTGITMFIIKGPSEAVVQQAKRELSVQLARKVQLTMLMPASLRAHVIGAGGKNIKTIIEQTGVRIQIPPRAADAGAAADEDDPLLGEQIEVTIEGDEVNAHAAQAQLQALIAERTSKITQRLHAIEAMYFPFLRSAGGARAAALAAGEGLGDVQLKVPAQGGAPVVVSGDREAVAAVAQALEAEVESMRQAFRTLSLPVPKRQHPFLLGEPAAQILDATQCMIELPAVHDPSEMVTIRGPQAQLPQALAAAMERANAVSVHPLDVHALHPAGGDAHAQRLVRWLQRGGRVPRADGVQVFLPQDASHVIDVVGDDAAAAAALHRELHQLLAPIGPHAVHVADVDPLVHPMIATPKGLKPFESQGVDVLLPSPDAASPEVVLVCRSAGDASDAPPAALEAAAAALAQIAAQAADVRTEHLQVPSKFHPAILGPDRTVLRAIQGDDPLQVLLGARHGAQHVAEPLTDDSVVVRGLSDAVTRAVARIQQIAADAEQDLVERSFRDELEVPAAVVPHLIGRGGAAVAKLRDDLGVQVDFADARDARAAGGKVPIVLTGRKVCVGEAKARLQAQAQRLADETTVVLDVPNAMHGALIGQGGKYVTRLQDKYQVRIQFPHANDTSLQQDQVRIRGGKKGVAEARAELLELLAYEQERSHVVTLSVPPRAIARVLGKAGAAINQLRLETGAQIDMDRSNRGGPATLRLAGSPAEIDAARAAIEQTIAEVEAETEHVLQIPSRFHGQIIGQGGRSLRELMERAGAPTDAKSHAQMVRFPRGGQSDEVLVRAPQALADKLRELLEKEAAALADRTVMGAVAPPRMHSQLIARGGRRHSPWVNEHNVQVIVPSWREYAELGEPKNAADLADADPAHVVKVHGPQDKVSIVLDEIQQLVQNQPQRRPQRARAMAARVDDADDDDADA